MNPPRDDFSKRKFKKDFLFTLFFLTKESYKFPMLLVPHGRGTTNSTGLGLPEHRSKGPSQATSTVLTDTLNGLCSTVWWLVTIVT